LIGSEQAVDAAVIRGLTNIGRENDMTNSVALVTGASEGIGRATALRLARDFSAVALAARSADRLDVLSTEIASLGIQALTLAIDLSQPASARVVVQRTLERFGRIDALVNIAGSVPAVDLFQMTDEQWESGFALKLHGARRLTLAAWAALKSSHGAVVFTSGNAADMPKAASAAVGTINAAIEALSKAFSDRGIEDGVQVNSISPGAIITGRRLAMLEKAALARKISPEEMTRLFLKQAGLERFGDPEEIADLIAFVVAPRMHWMTGTVLRMDGGEVKAP
jgi:3-oxoacyl-[acyl-carrier protein] reductase